MSNQENKKCFCARCFLPIDAEDKVEIGGEHFHRLCSMCCICQQLPTALKMFYGHVFCNDCFKTHMQWRVRGECPFHMYSNSWWTPGFQPQKSYASCSSEASKPTEDTTKAPPKRAICARCLQFVDTKDVIDIGGQQFHTNCAKCYFCQKVPTSNVKIYYGQVFCEQCFKQNVMNKYKDDPSEFFKLCFEQWQNNGQFSEGMRHFMGGNQNAGHPLIFMGQTPFCRCGSCSAEPQETFQGEPKKSFTSIESWDLSYEHRTEASEDIPEYSTTAEESANKEKLLDDTEKIEKLTMYIQEKETKKKWKNYFENDCTFLSSTIENSSWTTLRGKSKDICLVGTKCLWQCGPIYVNSDHLKKVLSCGASCQ